ncbi:MAG: nitroreductase family protein [Synergistaceae bacterium]|jgi:nitroreductase|nr:nitroreductase family protein [Synergistaceae bacterium]
MDFQNVLNKRYSVRSFASTPVEKEKLDAILEAGRTAPTAGNLQPHRIRVVQKPEELAKIDLCTPCRYRAPLVLIVCYDKNVCWERPFDGERSGQTDASIATTYMMLTAENSGLGSVWVMKFDPAKTVEEFGLPDNLVPAAMLVLGYPAKDAQPSDRHTQRFPMEKLLIP